ncbi:MAG: cupin domain-containing protein, partial [Vicinamibacterales bacterium]
MRVSAHTTGRFLLPVLFMLILLLLARSGPEANAQAPASQAAQGQPGAPVCPGQPMPSVQATGVYQPKPVPEITINGQPGPGAIWQPGMRSYWHCHVGGQIMMVHEGVGRVQKRGERSHTLQKGETEYAGPGVEHWHGASHDTIAHYFQTSIAPTTVL